jgi:REP element-mobilizing transposase RayT
MGRPRRFHAPGTISHVMAKGNGGQDIFLHNEDRLLFLGILEEVVRRCGCLVLTYCLMDNHFHLLMEVGNVPLCDIMRRVLCRYARKFNKTHGRKGHLFQSRFKAKTCLDECYLFTLLRYIHRNPIEAGLAKSPSDWPWSSHRQFIGGPASALLSLDRALALLADEPAAARRRYLTLMDEEDSPPFKPKFDAELPAQPRPRVKLRSLEELARDVSLPSGAESLDPTTFRRPRQLSRSRKEFAILAAANGHGGSAIARFLGIHPSAVTKYFAAAS